jgi:hypothetical protein
MLQTHLAAQLFLQACQAGLCLSQLVLQLSHLPLQGGNSCLRSSPSRASGCSCFLHTSSSNTSMKT